MGRRWSIPGWALALMLPLAAWAANPDRPGSAPPGAAAAPAFSCPVTPTISAPPPTPAPGQPAWAFRGGSGPGTASADWYISPDSRIWIGFAQLRVGASNKVFAIKPVGARLLVTGQRLDADAPPLHADISDGYDPTDYQVIGITFPTGGCWQIEATAGGSSVRFAISVPPVRPRPPIAPNRCHDLAGAVGQSDLAIAGEVVASERDGPWVWQTIAVTQAWWLAPGDQIALLQDARTEPLLQVGNRYLLLLRQAPFTLVCPNTTLALIAADGARLLPVPPATGADLLWQGQTLDEAARRIEDAFANPQTTGTPGVGLSPDCPITKPTGTSPRNPGMGPGGFGNDALWTNLWMWGQGEADVPPVLVRPDGSLDGLKWAWYRYRPGRLTIDGWRVDGPAPPLQAIIPDGYGDRGFQVSGLVFPTRGCWVVTGHVGPDSLTFVVRVVAPPTAATPTP